MSLASPDTTVVYSTDAGHVARTSDGLVRVHMNELMFSVCADVLPTMQRKLQTLCESVEGCACSHGCRWQLRIPCPNQPVLVLRTDEMRALDDLVHGAATMIELNAMLEAASIDWA